MGKVVSLDNLLASMEARRSEAAPWLSSLLGEAGEKFAHLGLPNRGHGRPRGALRRLRPHRGGL